MNNKDMRYLTNCIDQIDLNLHEQYKSFLFILLIWKLYYTLLYYQYRYRYRYTTPLSR